MVAEILKWVYFNSCVKRKFVSVYYCRHFTYFRVWKLSSLLSPFRGPFLVSWQWQLVLRQVETPLLYKWSLTNVCSFDETVFLSPCCRLCSRWTLLAMELSLRSAGWTKHWTCEQTCTRLTSSATCASCRAVTTCPVCLASGWARPPRSSSALDRPTWKQWVFNNFLYAVNIFGRYTDLFWNEKNSDKALLHIFLCLSHKYKLITN